MTFEQAKQELRNMGYTPSAGSWDDGERSYVFSVENHGARCYGHSRASIDVHRGRGRAVVVSNGRSRIIELT